VSTSRLFCTVLLLAACTDSAPDVTGIPDIAWRPTSAASAKSGGGPTVYAYTLSGDISTPTGSASTAKAQASNPFFNLSTSPCKSVLNGEYAPDFGIVAGRPWVGTLRITNTGTLIFQGTDVGGAPLQFTMSDLTGGGPILTTNASGPATYSYTDASLYFGSGGIGNDGRYRCVNLTVTATPSP
jgi:hypothetical protein